MGVAASCSNWEEGSPSANTKPHPTKKTAKEWGYDKTNGPETWADKYQAATGTRQSPIDLQISAGGGKEFETELRQFDELNTVEVHYNTTSCVIANNGHTVKWTPENGGHVKAKNKTFELVQFHYHIPSEHTFNSEQKALEIHFVHQEKETGTLLVLGHLFEIGNYNQFVHTISNCKAPTPGEQYNLGKIDLSNLSFLNGNYIHYQGSLTTPPCSEGVNWYVNKNLLQVSHAQIHWFRAAIEFDNARPVQKENNRHLCLVDVKQHGVHTHE